MGNFYLMQFALIISAFMTLISVSQSSEAGNWFSKSLDYFGLEKCSPLEKSGITGDFNTCLNSPVDSSSSSASSTGSVSTKYSSGNGQAKSGSGNTNSNWGKFGSSGFLQVRGKRGSGFGGFATSGGSFGQSSFTDSSPASSSPQSTSADSWPLSLIDDLQHMINCFPKLMKPCMIGSEVQFFNTIKNFFQAQVDYATPNASLIASVIASSGCVQGNSMDTSTVCYSTNIHKENWFGWKINWDDGQMCSFLGDISKCETDSYSKCPLEVRSFVDGLWKAGFKVTPCLDRTGDTITLMSTTLSSPLAVTDNPDDQSKSLALSVSSFKVNQSPSRPKNINSNDKQRLEVNVNSFAVDNVDSDGTGQTKSMVPERSQRRSIFDRMDDELNQEDQFNGNNENENSDYSDEGFEVNKRERAHSELRRVHKANIERHHDRNQREREIEDEQFSRIKEEFRRKMIDSLERRNSREYNEDDDEEDEEDEDGKFEIFGDRKDRYSSNRKNQEDERIRKYRKDQKGRKEKDEEYRERQRNEAEAQRERQQEEEERQREYEERAREDERRRNEHYERNQYKGERSSRPERYSTKAIPNDYWYGNKNANQVNNDAAEGSNYEPIRKCFESSFNSWSAKNQNSNDIMDLMCRKMESISSCLDNKQIYGQSIGHLMSIHGIICDPSRNLNDIDIDRVRRCLTY